MWYVSFFPCGMTIWFVVYSNMLCGINCCSDKTDKMVLYLIPFLCTTLCTNFLYRFLYQNGQEEIPVSTTQEKRRKAAIDEELPDIRANGCRGPAIVHRWHRVPSREAREGVSGGARTIEAAAATSVPRTAAAARQGQEF